jgi:cell division protein FtsW
MSMRQSAMTRLHVPQAVLAVEETASIDLRILIPTLLLVGLGVAMVFSAGLPSVAAQNGRDLLGDLKKELLFVVLGLAAMIWTSRTSLEKLEGRADTLYLITLLLLVGVHFLGKEVNGARSWYAIPVLGVSFQPSELAKLVLVIAVARYFAKFPRGLSDWRQMAPPLVMMGIFCASIVKEPDMGTVAVIGLSMLMFFHVAGAKGRYVGAIATAALLVVGYKVLHEPYQLARIMDWLFPKPGTELGGNYQINRALIALGSGGLGGCGYCGSIEKYFYLPEPKTDGILAVIGEELGLLATLAVVALFAYLVWQGMRIAAQSPDRFTGLVAAGISCFFGVQALVNIAVITGAMPTTGVTLPFVSYGGSSLLISLGGIGLLLNASRRAQEARVVRASVGPGSVRGPQARG